MTRTSGCGEEEKGDADDLHGSHIISHKQPPKQTTQIADVAGAKTLWLVLLLRILGLWRA
ncbi:hypothetical protein N7462_009905 [Penicillium macrosclerotiorum]|uniref:uncharacterized protein n=1 Tax=Penicillium macrosclerotiorum TaxID=303699 RepID=UPI00254977FA|nr:uncharacterized protein N7462_009905 [Penicillium macrosclerotiorum]KAJ5668835.1 hypothetical protein N7462_009905 [Penicillium macrosclerotiorum]